MGALRAPGRPGRRLMFRRSAWTLCLNEENHGPLCPWQFATRKCEGWSLAARADPKLAPLSTRRTKRARRRSDRERPVQIKKKRTPRNNCRQGKSRTRQLGFVSFEMKPQTIMRPDV